MAGEVRPIAMGVGKIKFGTVGDGVPGADLKDYPLPTKGSVAFNFADPKEVKIEVEGSEEPFYVELVKDTTDYVEFSIPTPSNEVLKELAGGEVDTTGGKNIWKKPLSTPSISKTFQCETLPKDGKKVVYTIVNGNRLPDQSKQSCCLFVYICKLLLLQTVRDRLLSCAK